MSTITLARPQALNAASLMLLRELIQAIGSVDSSSARAVIITGLPPAFCAGIDLRESHRATASFARERIATMYRALSALRALRMPVLVAIDGPCLGFGMELALSGDIRRASVRSKFGYPEVRVAVPAPTALISQAVGIARAQELTLTGRVLNGDEAFAMGIVHHLDEHVLEATRNQARELALLPRAALEGTKHSLRLVREAELDTAAALHADAVVDATNSPERLEALAAFADKRPARFEQ